jgi:hypothetical protein
MMAFSKVLSPQYFIWLLPVVALATVTEPLLGALSFVTLLLTQINFPAKYWALVYLEPSSVKWLAARNIALVACFLLALWRLIRLPAEPDDGVKTLAPMVVPSSAQLLPAQDVQGKDVSRAGEDDQARHLAAPSAQAPSQ